MSGGFPPTLPESGAASGAEMDLGPEEDLAERRLTRRRFVKFLMSFSVVSSIAIVVTPLVGFLIPSKTSSSAAGGKGKSVV